MKEFIFCLITGGLTTTVLLTIMALLCKWMGGEALSGLILLSVLIIISAILGRAIRDLYKELI